MGRIVTLVMLLALSLGARPGPEQAPSAPLVLRFAAIAPDGTRWARLLKDFAREIERDSAGEVQVKWYLGGVAGDETTTLDRVERGDLDGLAGAIFCQRVAPSLRVLEVTGLVQSNEEAASVLRLVQPNVEEDFQNTPFELLTLSTGFGHRVLFSRDPVRSLEEFKRGRYWVYDLDEVERTQLPLMGVRLVPLPIEQTAPAFDQRRVDGFISVPGAALLYRYSAKASYFTDLHSGYLPACMIVSKRTMSRLSERGQKAVREAGARTGPRFDLIGAQLDAELLQSGFVHQGLSQLPMSPAFRKSWRETAVTASEKLGQRLVSRALMQKVSEFLERQRR